MSNQIDEEISIPSDPIYLGDGREVSAEWLDELNSRFRNSSPGEILEWGFSEFGRKMVLGTGFGPSGILLVHTVSVLKLPAVIFCLDTGLLFEETYRLRNEIEQRFDLRIETVATKLTLEEQAATYGKELWKKDPDRCCYLRKVLPLQKYLSDKKAWVTGVRRSQAATREQTEIFERDPLNRVVKINPLAGWSGDQVWDYIHQHDLPYNPLHDNGYPTIGCVPCTEPASEEDERSGRWKNLKKTECGIHLPAQHALNGKNR